MANWLRMAYGSVRLFHHNCIPYLGFPRYVSLFWFLENKCIRKGKDIWPKYLPLLCVVWKACFAIISYLLINMSMRALIIFPCLIMHNISVLDPSLHFYFPFIFLFTIIHKILFEIYIWKFYQIRTSANGRKREENAWCMNHQYCTLFVLHGFLHKNLVYKNIQFKIGSKHIKIIPD